MYNSLIIRYFSTKLKGTGKYVPNLTDFNKLFLNPTYSPIKNNDSQSKNSNTINSDGNKSSDSKLNDSINVNSKNQKFDKLLRDKKGLNTDFNSLYYECLNNIFENRIKIENNKLYNESEEIKTLNKNEYNIINNIFKRVYANSINSEDRNENLSSVLYKENEGSDTINSSNSENYISSFWNINNNNINNIKLQILFEFNNLSKLVNNIELYKYKSSIKKALSKTYNENEFRNHLNPEKTSDNSHEDDYIYKNEFYWDPNIDKLLILRNNKRPFCFRDLHVLHNFTSLNGYILPRRINMTTRKQQQQIFKSIKISQQLALFPYNNKLLNKNRIPLMNPLQYLFDELFHSYKNHKNIRHKHIINVLMNKYNNNSINFHRYLKYESEKNAK